VPVPLILRSLSLFWSLCYLALRFALQFVLLQFELFEVDGLVAGSPTAGPASEDGLQEHHRLGECQAGRRAFGCAFSLREEW
jgi:hypothetical protein